MDNDDLKEEVEGLSLPDLPQWEDSVRIQTEPSGEGGQSDYHPSDDGEGGDSPQTVVHVSKREKYTQRAAQMFKSSHEDRYLLDPTKYYVVKLTKYSTTEKRWVNKGPVVIYFNNDLNRPRLVGNYLYSTKSICLDFFSMIQN
jgi:hypothetical protein